MTDAVQALGLTKEFGATAAVRDVTLNVPDGGVLALLGRNGAGKTTIIRMLLNLVRPTAGRSLVLRVDSRRLGPAEFARIGYMSADGSLPEWMSVGELLEFCRPLYPTWDDGLCSTLQARFELSGETTIGRLSRGTKIKLSLLTALAHRPRLLVLDEPFTGLDVVTKDVMIRGILELAAEGGRSMLVSAHEIDELERLADQIAVIDAGRLRCLEPLSLLLARFRRIDVVATAGTTLPDILPASWMTLERVGHRVTFVETMYVEGRTEAETREALRECGAVSAAPLSLQQIFVAMVGHERGGVR